MLPRGVKGHLWGPPRLLSPSLPPHTHCGNYTCHRAVTSTWMWPVHRFLLSGRCPPGCLKGTATHLEPSLPPELRAQVSMGWRGATSPSCFLGGLGSSPWGGDVTAGPSSWSPPPATRCPYRCGSVLMATSLASTCASAGTGELPHSAHPFLFGLLGPTAVGGARRLTGERDRWPGDAKSKGLACGGN